MKDVAMIVCGFEHRAETDRQGHPMWDANGTNILYFSINESIILVNA